MAEQMPDTSEHQYKAGRLIHRNISIKQLGAGGRCRGCNRDRNRGRGRGRGREVISGIRMHAKMRYALPLGTMKLHQMVSLLEVVIPR